MNNAASKGPCSVYPKPAASFMLVSCSAYSSTLKMEATCSPGKSVDFQRRYIPGHRTLYSFVVLASVSISAEEFEGKQAS
jgi:hypothetical protein